MTQQLVELIADMREEEALDRAASLLEAGTPALDVLDACRQAMETVGSRFEQGTYFVPELILAGEMLREITEMAKPRLDTDVEAPTRGKVVLGTVQGDIHDIGKDIVHFMLDVNGFEVVDLGVDVPVETFVDSVRDETPEVVALSGFLTLAYDAMRDTVGALEAKGLRDDVKVMIGGGAVDEQVCAYAGADAFGDDAMDAVSLAQRWTEGS